MHASTQYADTLLRMFHNDCIESVLRRSGVLFLQSGYLFVWLVLRVALGVCHCVEWCPPYVLPMSPLNTRTPKNTLTAACLTTYPCWCMQLA